MIRAVLILLALAITSAHADTVERCRIIVSTGDKVCEIHGKTTRRCHISSNATETYRTYDND